MVKEFEPLEDSKDMLLLFNCNVGLTPTCVTVMVCDKSPAFTVIVVERGDVDVFSDTYTVIVALFEPEDELNVHHVLSLLIVHEVFEVMVNESEPFEDSNAMLVLFNCTVGLAPACVTAMVCDCSPALTVIVALREDVDLFSETLTVIVPLFEPEEVLTVHQSWSLITFQLVLEVIVKESLPLSAMNDKSFLFNCSIGSAPL